MFKRINHSTNDFADSLAKQGVDSVVLFVGFWMEGGGIKLYICPIVVFFVTFSTDQNI